MAMRKRGDAAGQAKLPDPGAVPDQFKGEPLVTKLVVGDAPAPPPAPEPEPEPPPDPLQQRMQINLDDAVLGGGFEPIVTRLFTLPDPEAVYDELIGFIKSLDRASRVDYGSVVEVLDKGQEMAERAFALYVNARVAQERLEIQTKVVTSAMRDQANAILQREKDDKKRSKTITDADVESVMAAKYPDEYVEIETRRLKARKMVEDLKDLHERVCRRAAAADTMTRGARS